MVAREGGRGLDHHGSGRSRSGPSHSPLERQRQTLARGEPPGQKAGQKAPAEQNQGKDRTSRRRENDRGAAEVGERQEEAVGGGGSGRLKKVEDVPVHAHEGVVEEEILNYSDKRVRHEDVVTLSERFQDLIVRYGRGNPFVEDAIRQNWRVTEAVEQKLFSRLPFTPDDIT